jgi:N-sulfoglucosamine sulfohydrolase
MKSREQKNLGFFIYMDMNVLFISADDMSYHSTGLAGCEILNITPTLDMLGHTGAFFQNAHTTVGLCQPSRSVWTTGLYPWNNGATGFNNVFAHTKTLVEILNQNGFSTGIIGKAEHLGPAQKFNWDFKVNGYTKFAKWGKNANQFYSLSKAFLSATHEPFFLMVNSHFPHRPFDNKSRFSIKDVQVPGFLPDTPEVRSELALYYEGVARCDHTVQLILEALKESGKADNTLILFTSDHGMAFPFVKACCYHFSTKVPLIWNFPSIIKPKIIDDYVGGVDIFPTLLDFLDISCEVDGRSYKSTLEKNEPFNKSVYTCLCQLYSGQYLQTRAVHNKDYCYITNFWTKDKKIFEEDGSLENQASLQSLKLHRPKMYKKLRFRSDEEFYDIKKDPFAKNNITTNSFAKNQMKKLMLNYAVMSKDEMTISKIKSHMFL